MKITALIMLLIGTTAQAVEYAPIRNQDLSAPALNVTEDDQGNWLEITASEWRDVVYTDEGQASYVYQMGYNYQKQQGFLRTYTPDMQLVSEVYNAQSGGMVSREELLLAFELFKAHPEINQVLASEQALIHLYGGFGYADQHADGVCYQGNKNRRCVHVFAHTDSKSMVAHAIVKLSDRTIPYPDFDGIYTKKEVKQ